ncbi:hypothetical protein G6709_01990 [Polynucleobacter paneuropaeus]|nr:hypothetical protein [Polynucleobacter paneuropaeus]
MKTDKNHLAELYQQALEYFEAGDYVEGLKIVKPQAEAVAMFLLVRATTVTLETFNHGPSLGGCQS